MKFILIFLFLVTGSLCGMAQWNTSNMLRAGRNAIFFDDYVSAIDNFNNIIRVKPFLSEPYFFRGLAKLNLDDYEGAIQDFSEAVKLNPNYFQAYVYRGIAYQNLRRHEDALKDIQEAIAIDPSNAYVYANRGIVKAEMGDLQAAEKDYSKALQIDDKMLGAYLNRAVIREKMNNQDGAMADCNAAIKLNMFADEAYRLRGYLWYKQKDFHNAIEDFNRALKVNPENKQILMSRAIVWYEMKKYPETMADYSKVIEIDSNYIYAYYNRAMLRAEVGETNAAIHDLDRVVDMNPDNILIYFNRGLLKMEINDLSGAYNDFSESIRLYPDFVKAYLARAAVNDQMNNYAESDKDHYKANEIMARYRKMKAGSRNALVDTTANFQKLIDINAKDDDMREVINGKVQDKRVIVELQDVFYVQYQSLDSLRSGKVQYYNKHIMAYNQAHNYDPAITLSNKPQVYPKELLQAYMEKVSRKIDMDNSIDGYLLRGAFYLNQKEYPKAIDDFTAIVQKDPRNLLALFNRATAQMHMYDYIEALDDKAPKVIGGEGEVRNDKKIDYSLVIEDYQKCLEIDPDFVFARFNLGNVYAKNGEIDKAISTYTDVIRQDGDVAEAYFNRGLLYVYVGKKALANSDLSKAGELGLPGAYNIIKRYCKEY